MKLAFRFCGFNFHGIDQEGCEKVKEFQGKANKFIKFN